MSPSLHGLLYVPGSGVRDGDGSPAAPLLAAERLARFVHCLDGEDGGVCVDVANLGDDGRRDSDVNVPQNRDVSDLHVDESGLLRERCRCRDAERR